MKTLDTVRAIRANLFSPVGNEKSIKDYVVLANKLVWKRQASFAAAAVLAAFYYDPISVFVCYVVVFITEVLDVLHASKSKTWNGEDPVAGRRILKRITVNTALSAMAISLFSINMAAQETSAGHFTPLFLLLSASVFAAMYNSQMIGILVLRLAIYGVAFLTIALLDVFRYLPPLSSTIWLEFFTIIFVLFFVTDISAKFYLSYHKRIEQMKLVEEENERTKAALEIKSQFLATVSHELRTPLTSIVGSLELIRSDKLGLLPANLKPLIRIAATNGQRLATLVDDLLDLQKMEAGETVFNFKPIDANDLVHEAVESTAGFASKLGIDVTTEPCSEVCHITGDRNRLIQVMSNLLSNALKFSSEGGAVKVCVNAVGDRIRISVQDEGLGIPKGAEDRVFGKFSQVDSSDIRKVGGTGLGLNIAKQIIERHNAVIDYDSELGVGSTFYIEFDRLADQDGPSADIEPLATAA